jgi:hypothetical protein
MDRRSGLRELIKHVGEGERKGKRNDVMADKKKTAGETIKGERGKEDKCNKAINT